MTNDEANRIIAGWVGDEGFLPADECPKGHITYGCGNCERCAAGVLCHESYRRYRTAGEKCRHCGKKIGRGRPFDYCSSLDLTDRAISGRGDYELHADSGKPFAIVLIKDDRGYFEAFGKNTTAEALAHALADAIIDMQEEVVAK